MRDPYYSDAGITIYHGNCLEIMPELQADVLVTDPPFGIAYESNQWGELPRSIIGDEDTSLRDAMLQLWGERPALVFGSWRRPRPAATRMVLVWDSMGALGMGAMDLPWKPAHQEVYVLGTGFQGHRGADVLRFPPVQGLATGGRVHPHEKPLALMVALVTKCPAGTVLDPFMGSGTTLVAAKLEGRRAIGVEVDESYCEAAVRRLSQGVLNFA